MNNFNGFNGGDLINGYLQDLQQTMLKYSDYKPANANQLPFHAPANESEAAVTKKSFNKNSLFLCAATLIMILLTVLSIIQKSSLSGIIIMAALSVLFLAFTLKLILAKPTVLEGICVYKFFEHRSQNTILMKDYFMTVIVDPQKLMCQRVKITEETFNQVLEGTPVYVVNAGGFLQGSVKG